MSLQRQALAKEIYALENDEDYLSAVKLALESERQAAKEYEMQAHNLKIAAEERERRAMLLHMNEAREERSFMCAALYSISPVSSSY